MNRTKVREVIAAIVALVLVVVLFAGMSVLFGWNIPVISDIARSLGLQG